MELLSTKAWHNMSESHGCILYAMGGPILETNDLEAIRMPDE